MMIRLAFVLALGAGLLSGPTFARGQDPAHDRRSVAITFDDLPYAGSIGDAEGALTAAEVVLLNARVRDVLQRHSVPATAFVVEATAEALGDQARPLLRDWTSGGLSLGNHSYSHADTNALDLAGIEQEVLRGETSIRPLMEEAGKPLRFMRFPMNHTGDTEEKRAGIEAMLERLGYVAAGSTIDTSDYVFERAYGAALLHKDDACAATIRQAYVRHSEVQIDYYAALNLQVLGYEPPEIALLHLNRINADTLEALLELYTSRGYRFVSLDEAHGDPAYVGGSTFVSRYGPMWAYRWARERRVRVNGAAESEPPEWLTRYAEGEAAACDIVRLRKD